GFRQLSRECVLLAGMIRSKQPRQFPRQSVARAMTKWKFCQALNLASLLKHCKVRPHRDTSQRQDRSPTNQLKFSLKIGLAIRKLRGERLIRRGSASHHGCNVRILQLEPVIPSCRGWLVCKASAIKR